MTLSAHAKQIVSDFVVFVLVLPRSSALDGEGAAKQFGCVDGGQA
ncbi:hypothetical protein [Leucothrix pacifica]|nr:hypothetical protein [Leucothrix pacifica]